MYVLDTDTYSNFLRGHGPIRRHISRVPRGSVYRKSRKAPEFIHGDTWPAAIKRAGSQDCRIAAAAQVNGFTVVTANTAHFSKITTNYEDWSI